MEMLCDKEEEWRDIKGYEGLYQVSNLGRIKGVARISPQNHFLKERIRKAETDKDGYKVINLCKNGKVTMLKVHRLVGSAFLDNPSNKPQINHKDGCKCNNCVTNLEWVNGSENVQHAFDTGLKEPLHIFLYGEENSHCKVTDEQCKEIRRLKMDQRLTNRKLAEMYELGTSQIGRILKGEQRGKGSVRIGNKSKRC